MSPSLPTDTPTHDLHLSTCGTPLSPAVQEGGRERQREVERERGTLRWNGVTGEYLNSWFENILGWMVKLWSATI